MLSGRSHFRQIFVATTLLNRGIIYMLAILMLAAIKDAHHLREENLRLRTLRQTMVTVNDIVLNRLGLLSALIDLCEEGRELSPANFAAGRRVLKEVTQKLRRLGSQESTASYPRRGILRQSYWMTRGPAMPAPHDSQRGVVDGYLRGGMRYSLPSTYHATVTGRGYLPTKGRKISSSIVSKTSSMGSTAAAAVTPGSAPGPICSTRIMSWSSCDRM